jgi:GDP-4-dehydro-6-deoxy-D-mannose reductase
MVSEKQLPIEEDLPPHPYGHYGISKLAQTLAGLAAARSGRPVVVVRPFNIIGPGMPESLVVQSFAAQVKEICKGKQPPILKVGNLETVRDFLGIREAVRIYWHLIRTPAAYGEVVNVCSGKGTPVREVLKNLIELAGCAVEVRTDPSRVKEMDVPVHYGSIRKLQLFLGRAPEQDLKPLLREMLDFAPKR